MPVDDRTMVYVSLNRRPRQCCIGRVVAKLIACGLDFFTIAGNIFLRGLAFCISSLLSVGDIERIHGRTKKHFSKCGSSFVGASAKGYVEETRHTSVHASKRCGELLQLQLMDSSGDPKRFELFRIGSPLERSLAFSEPFRFFCSE